MLLLYLVVFPSYSLIFATYFGSWLQNLPFHAHGWIDELHIKLSDGHVSVFTVYHANCALTGVEDSSEHPALGETDRHSGVGVLQQDLDAARP